MNTTPPPNTAFISYDASDRQWALWIRVELVEAGFQVELENQHLPAATLAQELFDGIEKANQTIFVLSPAYVRALKTQMELNLALSISLESNASKLVPVLVSKCEPDGPLASLPVIDLSDPNNRRIQEQLLDGLSKARSREAMNRVPTTPPFPGKSESERAATEKPRFPRDLPILQYELAPRNIGFLGREQLLQDIHDRFYAEESGVARPLALCGIGGIGKTQAAIEYAYRFRASYETVLCIDADGAKEMERDVIKIAEKLYPGKALAGFNQAIAEVNSWLENNESWLLIVNNAHDLTTLLKHLPQKGRGHILLTTCAQATGGQIDPMPVEAMTREEGALLLLRRAKIIKLHQTLNDALPSDRQAAERICEALYGIPLALDQAGAYMEGPDVSLEEYEQLFKDSPAACLNRRGRNTVDHLPSLAETWWRSFERVKQANPAAAEILLFCSFLDAHPVPEEIIKQAAVHLSADFQLMVKEQERWWEAIAELRKHSFVQRDPRNKLLTVHPLLSIVLKDRLKEDEKYVREMELYKSVF